MTQVPVRSVNAYMTIQGAAAAIEFYTSAFGAVEDFRLVDPATGLIGHAEISLGGQRLFISDEYPDFGALSPDTLGGTSVKFHLEVDDVDAFVAHAVNCGAFIIRQPKLEFHGYRTGMIGDPFGYGWFVATRMADVSAAEMQRRWTEMARDQGLATDQTP